MEIPVGPVVGDVEGEVVGEGVGDSVVNTLLCIFCKVAIIFSTN